MVSVMKILRIFMRFTLVHKSLKMFKPSNYLLAIGVALLAQISYGDPINNNAVLTSLTETITEALSSGREWIWAKRDLEGGWGDETHRMLTTLILAGDEILIQGTCDRKSSFKQLELQLAVAIAKFHVSPISSGQLALYIDALHAVCKNPRDFYGINTVSKLKNYREPNPLHPFALALKALSLCNSGVHLDVETQEILIETATDQNCTSQGFPDTRAMAVIALSCAGITEKTNFYSRHRGIRRAVKDFKRSQNPVDGSFGNIYSSGIVYQALTAAETDDQGWNRTKALQYILSQQKSDGSFSDLLAAYYALPALAGKSFASLLQANCSTSRPTLTRPHSVGTTLDDNPTIGKVVVDLLIYVNHKLSVFRNVRVANNTTLYDVLDSEFSCEWKQYSFGPMLISLDGEAQDPATNKYWMFYQVEKVAGSDETKETALQTGAGGYHFVADTEIALRLQVLSSTAN